MFQPRAKTPNQMGVGRRIKQYPSIRASRYSGNRTVIWIQHPAGARRPCVSLVLLLFASNFVLRNSKLVLHDRGAPTWDPPCSRLSVWARFSSDCRRTARSALPGLRRNSTSPPRQSDETSGCSRASVCWAGHTEGRSRKGSSTSFRSATRAPGSMTRSCGSRARQGRVYSMVPRSG